MKLAAAIAGLWIAGALFVCVWIHGATRRIAGKPDLPDEGRATDAQAALSLALEAIAPEPLSQAAINRVRRSEAILRSGGGARPQGLW